MGAFDDLIPDLPIGPNGVPRIEITKGGSPYANAISSIESGGNYHAIGPSTRSGDRALGKYQIMSSNVGPWTQEVFGQPMSAMDFLRNPQAQDAVFNAKFGSYVDKYGPEGAAKAWFAGERGMNNPNARDALGTSVADYGRKFLAALGPSQANAAEAPQSAPQTNAFADLIPQKQAGAFDDLIPQKPNGPQIGAGQSFMRGAMQGLTANFGDELNALSNASGRTMADGTPSQGIDALLVGLYKRLNGDPEFMKRYESELAKERDLNQAASAQHPVANMLGDVTGAIAMPLGAVGGGATLPARMLRGAVSGGTYGALAGAGEGTDAMDRATRATTGGILGAAAGGVVPPVVEGIARGASAAASPIINAVRGAINPGDEAARRVATAVMRDVRADPQAVSRLTVPEFASSVQNGGPATIMDLGGETTRALARSAANTSPEGRQALNEAINDRFEGQVGRVRQWLNDTFNYPNARAQQDAMDQAAKVVNRGNYAKAYSDGDRPLWSPELERLAGSPAVEDAIKSAVRNGKDRAIVEGMGGFRVPLTVTPDGRVVFNKGPNGVPTYPNLQFWDYVRRELSDAAQRERGTSQGGVLKSLAGSLNTELDNLVPSYQQARAGASSFFGAQNALEAGQNFVGQNFDLGGTRQALAKMSPTERSLFQDGFVSRLIETLDKVPDRRSVVNQIANSPSAREKLYTALGPQKASQLEAGLRVEGIMDLARSAVQGNSTTARQLAELGLAGSGVGLAGYGGINQNPKEMTIGMVMAALGSGGKKIDQRVARRVAEMLVSDDPSALQRGIKLIASNKTFLNAFRSADDKIARVAGANVPTNAVLQGAMPSRANDKQPSPVGVTNQ